VKLLRIDSSPFGETGISRYLTEQFANKWLDENPYATIVRRDLATTNIPSIDAEWVSAHYTLEEARTRRQKEILEPSGEFIGEIMQADEYVIGLPMHNWGPPSRFKLWVDQIVTPSTLLERPLTGKRATFVIAAGRVHETGSPDASKNYLQPWLRTLFGCLGLTDMHFVFADGTKRVHGGEVDRTTFLVPHLEAIRALFDQRREELSHSG